MGSCLSSPDDTSRVSNDVSASQNGFEEASLIFNMGNAMSSKMTVMY